MFSSSLWLEVFMDPKIKASLVGTMLTNISTHDQRISLTFDTGDKLEISVGGGFGADGGFYQFLFVKINDKVVHTA